MALKKSDLYSSLWKSCDELRGGMDASQYKDYILTMLFVKYVSDKAKSDPDSLIEVPEGGSFDDMIALKGDKEIGDKINKIIAKLAESNDLQKVIDLADFNEEEKLGKGKEMQDRLSKIVTIFQDLDFRGSRAEGDDLLGDAYEYLMRHFATESGKSKGQFYTPAEVSRVIAKLINVTADTPRSATVYDPTCGSGSLLLKVAAESNNGLTIYGQEKDNATWALSKMNMILHGNEIADIRKGDTITNPQFTDGDSLKTFDFIVANPPFSIKSWGNGLEYEFGRFEYGMPPEKNGDYAFLLHILKSMKSTGKAAVILPHGVLFRGGKEGTIRTQLLKRGFIKGIIGLPANLFYGTGIPACIIVLDKENAQARTGVFMIDASKGFLKDGNKNRLRSQDMHKIVDVFTKQQEVERFSRMVPLSEISNIANDFNLNIPRYIDSSVPEDIQDLHAHIHGGIPERDLDALQSYWVALPSIKASLLEPLREGYSRLKVDLSEVKEYAINRSGLEFIEADVQIIIDQWFASHYNALSSITSDTKPNDLIRSISDDLLSRFRSMPLLDEYNVYEQLMTYWHETMHDDVYLIMADGWLAAAEPRLAIVDKERKLTEEPDLMIGTGKNSQKYKMDLIPPALIVGRYFPEEQAKLDELIVQLDVASAAVTEHAEEYGSEEGLLSEATNDKGFYTKQLINAVIKTAKVSHDDESLTSAADALKFVNSEAVAKKAVKESQSALDIAILKKYGDLTDDDVKTLVLEDKWRATVARRVTSEVQALTLELVARIQQLGERYTQTIGDLDAEFEKHNAKVAAHLNSMGVKA